MKIHLVAARTGPGNAGSTLCEMCGDPVFNPDGSIAYDAAQFTHTTDEPTYSGEAYAPEASPFTTCC